MYESKVDAAVIKLKEVVDTQIVGDEKFSEDWRDEALAPWSQSRLA